MQNIRTKDTFTIEFDKTRCGIDIFVPDESSRFGYTYIGFFDVTRVSSYPLIPDYMIKKLEESAPDDFDLLDLTNEIYDMMTEAKEEELY